MIVDHSNPMHDELCRCRACKPPMVGDRSDALIRVRLGAIGLVAVAVLVVRIGGLA